MSYIGHPLVSYYHLKFLKGNPNSQGTLNGIMQILHYYYRKQHKNIESLQVIEQNVVISLSLCLCLSVSVDYGLRFFRLRSSGVFPVPLNVTSDHS